MSDVAELFNLKTKTSSLANSQACSLPTENLCAGYIIIDFQSVVRRTVHTFIKFASTLSVP